MTLGGERSAVQDPLIRYAVEVGWRYVPVDEALRLRAGETGLVFRELLIEQLLRLNPAFLNRSMAEGLVRRLERIPPNVSGNHAAWEHLKGARSVFVPKEKRERDVAFLDAGNISNNVFHVTDEFTFTNGSKTNRPDVVFLVNGIPVFLVEAKAAKKTAGMDEALKQIRRYHRETPEMMALFQLYTLTHLIQFYYSATWNLSRKWIFNWKEEAGGDFESLVKTFVQPARVIRAVTDFILFTRQDDELIKIVLRPHQMRAVERVVQRAVGERKRRGLVWHTQGSGKTYTMIVAAQRLLENPALENPTVLMLVDRNELETQLFGHVSSVGVEAVEVAGSKRHLEDLLRRGGRGLIVTMIHKFDGIAADVNTRENVFVLVDEAHRTTGGKLGNYLMGALPNATYIGFTGTPIDKTSYGQGTFLVFGQDDPPNGYLDKYSIAESIEDGTTVRLHYSLAPNSLLVDRDTLEEEFLNLAEAEGVSDVESLNRVLERAVNLRNMLKNEQRVERVAEAVAGHYREFVEPMGYKAFLVGVDREACALYKAALDKHLPPEYSRVVYSAGHNDEPLLARHHLSEDEEKRVRKAFRKAEELPKILIVTEKLLTGFDAPILYCMYLDKPMRDHVLLQAIARVNRPYEDDEGRRKPSGFVLDFVGIFDNLEKALAFDSSDIAGVVDDVAKLKDRFVELIGQARSEYLTLGKHQPGDKAVEAVLEHFRDEEPRNRFYEFFRDLSDVYEVLSPDAFLRPFLHEYTRLSEIYRVVREAYEPHAALEKELLRKTAKLVREHTQSGKVRESLEIYEIDGETLRKIEESQAGDTAKVFNLLKSLQRAQREEGAQNPALISIGERAALISDLYKKRQRTTQQALAELKELVAEADAAKREQSASGMAPEVFGIYWRFKQEGLPDPEQKASRMDAVMRQYPHWRTSAEHERRFKQELYKMVLKPDSGGDAKQSVAKAKELVDAVMRSLKG